MNTNRVAEDITAIAGTVRITDTGRQKLATCTTSKLKNALAQYCEKLRHSTMTVAQAATALAIIEELKSR